VKSVLAAFSVYRAFLQILVSGVLTTDLLCTCVLCMTEARYAGHAGVSHSERADDVPCVWICTHARLWDGASRDEHGSRFVPLCATLIFASRLSGFIFIASAGSG
jgi:hypothetical protein